MRQTTEAAEPLPISSGGEAEALPEADQIIMANTSANEDDKTKMDAFVAQCWRKVDMYVSLAQGSTSTTAMMDRIKARNVNTKRSERQPSETKLRSFILFNYDMNCAKEASAHPITRVPPFRGNGDHLKQCLRAALDAVNDAEIPDRDVYMLFDGGWPNLKTQLLAKFTAQYGTLLGKYVRPLGPRVYP
jgi:hypothetical protein